MGLILTEGDSIRFVSSSSDNSGDFTGSAILARWEIDPDDGKSVQLRIPSESFSGSEDRIAFYVSASGEIGVNTKTPTSKFQIATTATQAVKQGPTDVVGAFSATGDITSSGTISSSGDIIGQNFTSHDVISTSFTGSVDNPAIRFGPLSGNLAGNKVGLMMEELIADTTFFVPYFCANGTKIFGFGTLMDMKAHIQMNENKIMFDGDSTNTFIYADTSTPENIEIHADGNIELRADDDLQVYSDVDITGEITASGNISSSGTLSVSGIDGGTF